MIMIDFNSPYLILGYVGLVATYIVSLFPGFIVASKVKIGIFWSAVLVEAIQLVLFGVLCSLAFNTLPTRYPKLFFVLQVLLGLLMTAPAITLAMLVISNLAIFLIVSYFRKQAYY